MNQDEIKVAKYYYRTVHNIEKIATANLVIGIVVSVILFFVGISEVLEYGDFDLDEENIYMLLSIIPVLMTSLTIYGILRILCLIAERVGNRGVDTVDELPSSDTKSIAAMYAERRNKL